MRTTAAFAVIVVTLAALLAAGSPSGAQAPAGDSVTGSGTMNLGFLSTCCVVTPFEFDVHSGPSGEDPTGHVTFSAIAGEAPVTCLAVRTLTAGPTFAEATINISTSEFGLVTLQVDDGDPEGLPDTLTALTSSPRSPTDCSPLSGGNVVGTVLTGDIDIVDAPPLLTAKEQCKRGGWLRYGFHNQGQCVAFVDHPQIVV